MYASARKTLVNWEQQDEDHDTEAETRQPIVHVVAAQERHPRNRRQHAERKGVGRPNQTTALLPAIRVGEIAEVVVFDLDQEGEFGIVAQVSRLE